MNNLLRRALESGEILEMIYLSDKGEISRRKIKVKDISPSTFTAYCFLRHKRRVFNQSNVLSIEPFGISRKKGA